MTFPIRLEICLAAGQRSVPMHSKLDLASHVYSLINPRFPLSKVSDPQIVLGLGSALSCITAEVMQRLQHLPSKRGETSRVALLPLSQFAEYNRVVNCSL